MSRDYHVSRYDISLKSYRLGILGTQNRPIMIMKIKKKIDSS